jgi:trehalose 6-phosphate synthase
LQRATPRNPRSPRPGYRPPRLLVGWSSRPTDGNITAALVDLSRRDYDEYYIGYANRVLWPLFHYRPSLIGFSRRDLAGYLRVNRNFAQALAPMLLPEDLVWVHDYHLIPLGEALRQLGCRQPIGFFLHTPFPAAELMRIVPNHRELVAALCAYDLVGFQTAADLEGFRDYLLRQGGGEDLGGGRLRAFGRALRAGVFPIGIDVATVARQAQEAEESRQMRRLTSSIRDRSLIIGVDRIDYSKGLPARFAAYSHLLEHYPQTRGRTVLMQIASPSRSDVPEYREIRKTLEAAAGNINGRYAEFDWTPLRYLNKSFNHRILSGFYRAARIGLVTPFRDGMNLVAKEYVAAQRPEDPGILVLSCFAGAVREMAEAIIVNPYDLESMAEGIWQGLQMPLEERRERWTAMKRFGWSAMSARQMRASGWCRRTAQFCIPALSPTPISRRSPMLSGPISPRTARGSGPASAAWRSPRPPPATKSA